MHGPPPFFSIYHYEQSCGVRSSEEGRYTDKKENKIFLIYKEIQMGSGAKSYMRNDFLKYEEMHKYFHHM
jgi:hypothetical protein